MFGRKEKDDIVARQGRIEGGIEGERREVDQLKGGLEFRGAAVEIGRGFSRCFLQEERSETKELARGVVPHDPTTSIRHPPYDPLLLLLTQP